MSAFRLKDYISETSQPCSGESISQCKQRLKKEGMKERGKPGCLDKLVQTEVVLHRKK